MSALQSFAATQSALGTAVDIKLLGPFFWQWYHTHADDVILRRKIWFFNINIHVRDLHALFVQLFGPEPLTV